MATLENYLAENHEKGIATHTLTVRGFGQQGAVHFYIHPANADGETPDFLVSGNELIAANSNGEAIYDPDDPYAALLMGEDLTIAGVVHEIDSARDEEEEFVKDEILAKHDERLIDNSSDDETEAYTDY